MSGPLENVDTLLVWPTLTEGCDLLAVQLAHDVESSLPVTLTADRAGCIARHLAAAAHMLARYDERFGE